MTRVVSIDSAASAWLQAVGCQNLRLPPAAVASADPSIDSRGPGAPVSRAAVPSTGSVGTDSDLFAPAPLEDAIVKWVQETEGDLLVVRSDAHARAVSEAGWGGDVYVFAPRSLPDVLKRVLALSRMCGCEKDAMDYIGRLESELLMAQRRQGISRKSGTRGTVLVLTGLHPLQAGGYWIDDLFEQAGAVTSLETRGRPPATLSPADIARLKPDQIFLPANLDLADVRERLATELDAEAVGRVRSLPRHLTLFEPLPSLYTTIDYLIAHLRPR